MLEKLGRVGMTIVACFVMWLSVAIVETIMGSGWVRDIAVLSAFGATVALWLILALPDHDADARKEARLVAREKTKRAATDPTGSDARLALLLELMDEDERRSLKARLTDDLGTDGELALADLLAAQESDTAYRENA